MKDRIEVDQTGMVDLIRRNQIAIESLDKKISSMLIQKASIEEQNERIAQQLRALQNTPESIEVVELEWRYIPLRGCSDRAYIATHTTRINKTAFVDMRIKDDCLVAFKCDKAGMVWKRCRIDLKCSQDRIVRGMDNQGFQIIEYVDRCYLEHGEYQKLILKANRSWQDQRVGREFNARFVVVEKE